MLTPLARNGRFAYGEEMLLGEFRIAIVHDELTRRGGAEVVLEELLRVFPQADLYALYAGASPGIVVDGRTHSIRTSSLQRWPRWFRHHPARLLPFLAQAAEQIDLSQYDVVLSSASAFAKAVVTRARVPHLCYCHTPTRYLWERDPFAHARRASLLRWPGRAVVHYLRLADFTAAQRVDYFVANSQYTAERIQKYYRRPSEVVFPPVDTTFFTPGSIPRTDLRARPFLCVGRLSPSKLFDQAIAACEKMQLPLFIVGSGPHLPYLKRKAGRHTKFVGRVTPEHLRALYRTSRALLQPGVEDFGLAAAEAQACGLPVLGFGQGGLAEIVQHGETGWLYHPQRVEALAEAVRRFNDISHTLLPEHMQQRVLKFSRQQFRAGMERVVHRALLTTGALLTVQAEEKISTPAAQVVY